jgi:hypothetical protein
MLGDGNKLLEPNEHNSMGGGLMALLDIFTLHVNHLVSAGQLKTSKGLQLKAIFQRLDTI